MADKICTCPKCGGDIVENNKAYGCSNWREADGGCKVTVWKNISGRDISVDEAKAILTNGESEVLDGFVSKRTGKPFSAKLVLEDGRVVFKFPERN